MGRIPVGRDRAIRSVRIRVRSARIWADLHLEQGHGAPHSPRPSPEAIPESGNGYFGLPRPFDAISGPNHDHRGYPARARCKGEGKPCKKELRKQPRGASTQVRVRKSFIPRPANRFRRCPISAVSLSALLGSASGRAERSGGRMRSSRRGVLSNRHGHTARRPKSTKVVAYKV